MSGMVLLGHCNAKQILPRFWAPGEVGFFEGVVIKLSEKMLHTSNLDIHRRANLVLHRDLGSSKSV